ncbi:hypothetical protein SAMN02745121_03530 [Nannocystis exedens]|uniref:Uncharacterized protein n=1 Tax=Nannocystis exedens TaxID=54 RepID=A0A1I1YTA7_9BACT|nr:hypothetical protein [Nannocystis exedens]PCC70149.1 hypothetical protein NAEX_03182 [Nannocystis exedens]SFE22825.1 hypothetical protein SAMN02745121_03530 [Nannocystis exedens]
MLPYLVRARWTAFTLLLACSFDGSGLVSAGPPSPTSSTTGDPSTTTGPGATVTPTTLDPEGTMSEGATMSTTTPVDPTDGPTTTTSTTTLGTTTTTTTEPETTTTTSTTGPDTTTSSTTSTDTSTTTGPDTTTGPVCVDDGTEPNENEGAAVDLGDQYCKDQPKSFEGVLDGDGDVDWFRYHGDFSGNQCDNNDPDPIAKIVVTADGPLEVCLYADCDIDGDTAFTCPNGTMTANSPGGREGCCGTGSMEYAVNCVDGGNESAEMYVRLQKAQPDACVAYKVDYSYFSP